MFSFNLMYKMIGSLAALGSAAAWAFGSILFRKLGQKVHPVGMTFVKSIIGMVYIGIVILLLGIKPVTPQSILFLCGSGILGIALGDTFFFKSLIYLGPRLTVLLGSLGPVFTVILAVVFLGETPSFIAWIGMGLTIVGVTWVMWERSSQKVEEKKRKNRKKGIVYSLLSTFCISVGIIFAKVGITASSTLQATFIRFFGGLVGLTLFGTVTNNFKNWISPFKNPKLIKFAFFTVFVVVFGGFWLFIVSLKYINASIASILNSTSPLFILPMAVFFLNEKISSKAIIGAIIAVTGIVLIFLR